MQKKNKNLVTYVITLYNKKRYLLSTIKALVKEGGSHKREYIFIDDGSDDNTFLILKKLTIRLTGEVKIIRRKNMGASYSTNEAISIAKGYWIRLLDGDDIISYKSTEKMLQLARKKKEEFVYGLIHKKKYLGKPLTNRDYKVESKLEGLKKFIRNCPANSSCIFLSVKRFVLAGGCDSKFVSPDQVLFLRLFASGRGVFLNETVALMPLKNFPGSLSHQVRRSRYESILALIRLCEEYNEIDTCIKKLAFKRALSRANTYNKFLNNRLFSVYLVLYFLSKFYFPENYLGLMYKCLKVFTKDIDRPKNWLTGFEKKIISKSKTRQI